MKHGHHQMLLVGATRAPPVVGVYNYAGQHYRNRLKVPERLVPLWKVLKGPTETSRCLMAGQVTELSNPFCVTLNVSTSQINPVASSEGECPTFLSGRTGSGRQAVLIYWPLRSGVPSPSGKSSRRTRPLLHPHLCRTPWKLESLKEVRTAGPNPSSSPPNRALFCLAG